MGVSVPLYVYACVYVHVRVYVYVDGFLTDAYKCAGCLNFMDIDAGIVIDSYRHRYRSICVYICIYISL